MEENRNKPKVDKLNRVVSGGSGTASGDNIPSNFNQELANTLLHECDLAFLKSFNAQQHRKPVTSKDLQNRVDDVRILVRRSFFPSPNYQPTPQDEFNYEVYSHFKAFNDILIENDDTTFPRFYAEFERDIGTRMVDKIPSIQSSLAVYSSSTDVGDQVQNAFKAADMTGTILLSNGLINSWERAVKSKEDIEDFIEPYTAPLGDNFSVTSDLQFTLALMGDVTLNSQLLLQELGYRLYPSFGRWILQQSLIACFPGIDNNNRKGGVMVNIDDYFMDTAYNSNPDLFQVRQILMNVVLQRN
eukprot:scaffold9320_cov71-Cyclotella_meneghiniana.AAC.19